MAMYRATLTRLPPQSPVRKALVSTIFAGSADLKMDETGRIKLTDELIKVAGLNGRVKFAGNIDSFQIWDPDKHAAFTTAMSETAAKPETLAALGEAYNDVLRQHELGHYPDLKLVEGGEG